MRFIPFGHYNPYLKIALNEVSIDSVQKTGKPILWLAGWKPSCVNAGYGQKITEVLDLKEAEKLNLLIVRRQGGGGAMYLSEDGEISWSIASPKENFPEDVNEIYRIVCGKIVKTLADLGITAKHKPINDVVTEKGKISGATIKKYDEVVYIGGTLLYKVDKEILRRILRPERDTLKRKSLPENEKKVTSVSEESNAGFEDTIKALKGNLLKGVEYAEDKWTAEELSRAEKLAKKYSSKEWLYHDEGL